MNESSTKARARAGLGRGLGALLDDITQVESVKNSNGDLGVRTLPVASLAPHPGQPRRHFEDAALEELTQSIIKQGMLQPIVVRRHGASFQIVAGERRWRAAQRAQLHEVPVIVRDLDDGETLEIALIENIQREDLNAIEEAQAYRRLMDEFHHTQEALGQLVHKSRSHIANLLRLLDLPPAIQDRVSSGILTMGHARALIGISDAESIADDILARGLSVRETERLVRRARIETRILTDGKPSRDPDLAALEHQLGDLLGLTVKVTHSATGGSLILSYSTLDQLDMICQRLTGERV